MERYGEKPKKFTKAWFEYVWDYYKLHIIIGLIVIVAIVYTWIAITTAEKYDLYICIAGEYSISDTSKEKIKDSLKDKISDINGDGAVTIQILDYSIPQNYSDAEYAAAMQQKLDLELQAGDSFIFVVSKDNADRIAATPAMEGLFESSGKLNNKENENKYFAPADNSDFLKNAGIPFNDLYIGVRNFTYNEGNEEDVAHRANALIAAKSILGN